MTLQGMTPVPADDTIPWQITDTVTRGTVKPTYPVIAYPHTSIGATIAGGFIYRGKRIPALRGKLLFGDITTGRIYAEMKDVLGADDGNLDGADPRARHRTSASRRTDVPSARGPRRRAAWRRRCLGTGTVDVRFAEDGAGELTPTKSDGMIRRWWASSKGCPRRAAPAIAPHAGP